MNERARWRYRRLVLTTVAVLGAAAAGWWCYQQAVRWATAYYGIQKITLQYADIYDKQLPSAIEAWLENRRTSGGLHTLARHELANQLLKEFPLIRSVSWATYLPGAVHCAVTGVRPTFVINKRYVAGNNGRLYTKQDFAGYQETMPVLHVSKDWLSKGIFAGVHTFFSQLPAGLLRTYNMYYHDPYRIALVPVDGQELTHRCVCLVDEQSASRVRALDELMALCVDLKKRVASSDKNPVCFFDFRFQDRIISRLISKKEFDELQRVLT